MPLRQTRLILVLSLLAVLSTAILFACAPAMLATENPSASDTQKSNQVQATPAAESSAGAPQPQPTQAPAVAAPTATPLPQATSAPSSSEQGTAAQPPATQQIVITRQVEATQAAPAASTPTAQSEAEARILELEYPPRMRLGDSDIIRISLIPSYDGYTVRTEFPDHQTDVQNIQTPARQGYILFGVARLEGVGFDISPLGEQPLLLEAGKEIAWHWSLQPRQAGQQRLAVRLLLRWLPAAGVNQPLRESLVFSRGISVQVDSFFGLNRSQTMSGGLLGLILGAALCLLGLVYRPAALRPGLLFGEPNPALAIEPPAGLRLSPDENTLLRTLFRDYGRLILQGEFLSGYSGARTFLARPLRPDGRADAHTIIKIGEAQAMGQEYRNYERYVKHTLPPVTARIQQTPVSVRGGRLAAVQYTFIGTPDQPPVSLRQALLANPDPALLDRLFETFGPNWWMQRRPYTFRLALEYDRVLPAHLVIEPLNAGERPRAARTLDGGSAPAALSFQAGDIVTLRNFPTIERRIDGRSLSLQGSPPAGQPPLRLRWLGLQNPVGASGRVVGTRDSLLANWVQGFERFGLPDPLAGLPAALREPISGSQSTIHGDLNLENILVGPGGFVWLIDFAMTRDGHPLFDFTHLAVSLISQVIAPQVGSASAYRDLLAQRPFDLPASAQASAPQARLLARLAHIAGQCLANPTQPREFYLALYISCLGGLKYANLQPFQKHLLYLTAADLQQNYL